MNNVYSILTGKIVEIMTTRIPDQPVLKSLHDQIVKAHMDGDEEIGRRLVNDYLKNKLEVSHL